MKVEKRKAPKLRFPGFTGDWEQCKLSDVSEKVCVGFVGTCEKYYTDESGIPMYRTGNLKGLTLNHDDMKYVTREFHEKNQKSQLRKGDILIARHGDSGKAVNYELSEEANCLNIVIIRPDIKQCSYKFLADCINSPAISNHIKSLSAGSTQAVVNTSEIEKLDVIIPRTIDEQKRIADFLGNLDTLITFHQRKLDQIKEYKKGMLQKMFPKKGETVPEVRFPEFEGDWDQYTLGELGFFKNGMNFSKEAMNKGYPFVNLQNIFGHNEVNTEKLGLAEATDTQLKEYNLLRGDTLFVRSSVKLEGVGEAALIPQNLINTTYSGFLIRFRDESNIDYNFKRFLFGIKSVRDQIMSKATNSANKNISQDVLMNLEISLPLKEEQQKIGEYFSYIDNFIALHQLKLEQMKEYKKGLLQQMFV